MGEDTTIRISRETWQRLHNRKGPGDTFDGVLQDLLDDADCVLSDDRSSRAET